MEILIKALQLVFSLAILILIHEFGHFIPAKLFKIRVEKFYLFFDPWFSLFKFKRKDTEYGVGWLPLGGYCKIAGMIDESMDKEAMKKPPQPWEFRSKPTWQRLIVMLGGVTMNLILAIFIYISVLFVWGEQYLPTSNVKYGIAVDSTAEQIGLRNGDKILSLDNKVEEDFHKIPMNILLDKPKTIQVIRNGEKMDIIIPEGTIAKIIKSNKKSSELIGPRFPFEIGDFTKDSPAKNSGLKVGDKLIGINDVKINYFDEFRKETIKHKNQQVEIVALRVKDTIKANIKVPNEGLIGIYPKSLDNYFVFSERDYSFFEAIPAGTSRAFYYVSNYLKQLRLIFSPDTKAYESLGGFISIGKIFPSEWDWQSFWGLTAFLSVILAIMNVLPIPALDGGHVIFLLYEMITRRKPSDKFLEYAQIVGMVILLGLLVYANGNDIVKLFR